MLLCGVELVGCSLFPEVKVLLSIMYAVFRLGCQVTDNVFLDGWDMRCDVIRSTTGP